MVMQETEIQDYINVYSMVRFADGHREPGIVMNRFSLDEAAIEYFFVQHNAMNEFKKAQAKSDHESCNRLSYPIDMNEIVSISPINLSDYKLILELHNE